MTKELPWDELVDIAKKILKKNVQRAKDDRLQHYSFVSFNGSFISKSGICYGNVPTERCINNAIFTDYSWVNFNEKPDQINKEILEYLQWWVNNSFVAPVFINKDIIDIIYGGALFDCKYPGALIIVAGMGIRLITHYPSIIKNWYKFKEYIGPDAAICAAHVLTPSTNKTWAFYPTQTWFTIDAYKEQMKRIVRKNPIIENCKPFRTHTNYLPLSQIFNCSSRGGGISRATYPFPKGINIQIKDSFGKTYKLLNNVYTEEMLENTLKEYVKMHMEL